MKARVFGLVDHAHAATAKFLENAVVRNGLAGFIALELFQDRKSGKSMNGDATGASAVHGPMYDPAAEMQALHGARVFEPRGAAPVVFTYGHSRATVVEH